MSKLHATVSKIIKFSCVDGPGNRLVIFLQGCNFNCLNCHNPHTIGLCDSCGDCADACPEQALVLSMAKVGGDEYCDDRLVHKVPKPLMTWNANACIGCDACIDTCDKSASPRTSRYSVGDLIKIIENNVGFINGVTVSGGEATLQAKFIAELFRRIKQAPTLAHLTCFIDSNGSLAETAWRRLLPLVDGVMLDLKAWSQEVHTWLTGHYSYKVLESIEYLAKNEKLHELRLLHIPSKTDFEQNIEALSEFLIKLPGNVPIRLNAFRNHGVSKEASQWPNCTKEQLEMLADALRQRGINNIILPSVY